MWTFFHRFHVPDGLRKAFVERWKESGPNPANQRGARLLDVTMTIGDAGRRFVKFDMLWLTTQRLKSGSPDTRKKAAKDLWREPNSRALAPLTEAALTDA